MDLPDVITVEVEKQETGVNEGCRGGEKEVNTVMRGGCGFLEKSMVANERSLPVLIIEDIPGNKDVGLMGGEAPSGGVDTVSILLSPAGTKGLKNGDRIVVFTSSAKLTAEVDSVCSLHSPYAIPSAPPTPPWHSRLSPTSIFVSFSLPLLFLVPLISPTSTFPLGVIFISVAFRIGPTLRPRLQSAGAFPLTNPYEHRETDEMVFLHLSRRVAALRSIARGYAVQDVIEEIGLSRDNYDKPMFHHPPLFSIVTGLWETLGLPYPLLPLLLSALVPITMLLLLPPSPGNPSVAGTAAVAYTFTVTQVFASMKLWSDNMLPLFSLLSVLLAQRGRYNSAGAAFAIGCMVKVTALGLAPGLLLATWGGGKGFKENIWNTFNVLGTGVVGYGLWACYYAYNASGGGAKSGEDQTGGEGVFFDLSNVAGFITAMWPSSTLVSGSTFMSLASNRSPWFYLRCLSLSPHLLFSLNCGSKAWRNPRLLPYTVVVATYVAAFTGVGAMGGLYQSRHVLPCMPFLAVLAAEGFGEGGLKKGMWGDAWGVALAGAAMECGYAVMYASVLKGDYGESVWGLAEGMTEGAGWRVEKDWEADFTGKVLRGYGVL